MAKYKAKMQINEFTTVNPYYEISIKEKYDDAVSGDQVVVWKPIDNVTETNLNDQKDNHQSAIADINDKLAAIEAAKLKNI